MIRSILSLSVIFLLMNSASGQYNSFPTDSASWTNIVYSSGDFGDVINSKSHFGLVGDTIINGLVYSKLYRNPPVWNGVENDYSCFYPDSAIYTAAMREDAANKIWSIISGETEEFLLYNFALELGDTFCFHIAQPSTGETCFPVVLVDSIVVNGNYRRRIHFEDDYGSESWIEGIGSTTYPYLAQWSLIGNLWSVVECYTENNAFIYGDSTFCDCSGIGTGVHTIDSELMNLNIYPNPALAETTIEFSVEKTMDLKIRIQNSAGQQLYHSEEKLTAGPKKIKVELPLIPGVYLFFFVTEGEVVTRNIIRH